MNKYTIFLITLLTLCLNACSNTQEDNILLVATSADNPPYEYMKNGEIVGFDVDLMNEIGKRLNKKIEFQNMELHGLIAALSSNNVDAVIAALSITKERKTRVDFSIPYNNTQVAILYRKEDAFNSIEDLTNKIVGAQLGTTWNLIANDMATKYKFQTKTLANNLMLVEELKNKRLDAIILETVQIEKFIGQNPSLNGFPIKQYSSEFAIAMPKNSCLKKDIDHIIQQLHDDGTIKDLSKKWGIISAD